MHSSIVQFFNGLEPSILPEPLDREQRLQSLVDYLVKQYQASAQPKLNFICTHNSRRSHFGQFLSVAAAEYVGLPELLTYSGGAEVTACHPNTLNALQAVGFVVEKLEEGINTKYAVEHNTTSAAGVAYSKLYNDAVNPQSDYAAILVCGSADAACPVVFGADIRILTPYEDPKEADDTAEVVSRYMQTAQEFGQEMLWVFSKVKAAVK